MMFYNYMAASFIVRVFLGVLFFAQGFDKVFHIKVHSVIHAFEQPLEDHKLPAWMITWAGVYTSYIELICGFMLIIGLFKSIALYLLGIDLLMVCIAFSIIKPMWDIQFVFPRLILLIALLVMPANWDVISVDYLIGILEFIQKAKSL
ncbi:MAG: DoxX family membrane protein [Bacteroidetes bacterium]|nr:DoxX family membrane protein [Bacteroidota bacterium]